MQIKTVDMKKSYRKQCFAAAAALIILLLSVANGFCEDVSLATARQVAQNQLTRHIALYGHWNNTDSPGIAEAQVIYNKGDAVAYNFSITPSGHILVAVDDAFSPVLFYSTTSTLDADRIDGPDSIESWIIPELGHQVRSLEKSRAAATQSTTRALSVSETAQRISAAWELLSNPDGLSDASGDDTDATSGSRNASSIERSATIVGPFLETMWGQESPYNLKTPTNNCTDDAHTVSGCVATAWAQLMRYWQWPEQGYGSNSYTWENSSHEQITLEANFGETEYDWDNMPVELDADSTDTEITAVSTLIYHVGIAAETNFGCDSSGSGLYANEVLDQYFRYKSSMIYNERSSFSAASDWFALFQTELDADPPRPVILSIFTSTDGHEVIVDGYQTDEYSDMVHIVFGWDGSIDEYYDITSAFEAGGHSWEANSQIAVTGIEPDYTSKSSSGGGGGSGACFLGILF